MDWCVDLRVEGAAEAAVADIADHLRRHAELSDVVDLAVPLVAGTLEPDEGSPMRWLSIMWDRDSASLAVADLGANGPWPQPGPSGPPLRLLAPGVALANDAIVELRAATVSGPVVVDLPVVRAPEPDIDPEPLPLSELPVDRDAFLLAALGMFASDRPDGRPTDHTAAQWGATLGAALARRDGERLRTVADCADAFVAFERGCGGGFFVIDIDDNRAVLGNHHCPFEGAARQAPSLCRVTSALAGRLVADATGKNVNVALPEQLAAGDHQCRLVMHAGAEPEPTAHHYTVPAAGLSNPVPQVSEVFTRGLQVALSLRLPRDQLSVPLVRRLTRHALTEVGVVDEDRGDVELAVTEAAANVMDHAGPGDAYEVRIEVNPVACEIRVVDIGRGFDHEHLGSAMAEGTAEEGRGIALMHALMDQVRFSSNPERGTIVHLVKHLRFDDSAPARGLLLKELDKDGDSPTSTEANRR